MRPRARAPPRSSGQSSPIYFANGLKGALLICHGMVDTNVHFQDTVRLVQKLIDDDPANLSLFENILRDDGYRNVLQISDSREAVAQFSYHDPDLVLLDWRMPHDNGYEVLTSLGRRYRRIYRQGAV